VLSARDWAVRSMRLRRRPAEVRFVEMERDRARKGYETASGELQTVERDASENGSATQGYMHQLNVERDG